MKVINLNGKRQSSRSGERWLAAWEKHYGQTAFMCFAKQCINRPSVCGLVQADAAPGGKWYIVPLCEECNSKTGQDLDIWDLAALVPAEESLIASFEEAVVGRPFAPRAIRLEGIRSGLLAGW